MSRSSKRFGFFRRSGKELLPVKPVDKLTILPWWIVQLGFVTEEDMKLADKAEVIILHCFYLDYPLCKSFPTKPVVHKVH
jgi:hypothetical protein